MSSNFSFLIDKDSKEYSQIQEILKQNNKSFKITNLDEVLKEDEDIDGIDSNDIINPEIGKVVVFDNGLKLLLNSMYKTGINKIKLLPLENISEEIIDIELKLYDINTYSLCSVKLIEKE